MPRRPRIYQQAVCYHLYNRGINRETLFHDQADYARFIATVAQYKQRCRTLIYHWALMPNHYHLLISVPFVMLRPFAGGLQQAYAQYHHRRHATIGVVWQGRYHTRPVEADECLTRCGRYIECNPVRAAMVPAAWDWPFSSAAYYVLGRADAITDLDGQFDPTATHAAEQQRQTHYAALLQDPADDAWMAQQTGTAIGSAEFQSRWLEQSGRSRLRRGRPPGKCAGVSV